jgi:uncharacterized protein YndB with AHSA1/START domain
MAPSDDYKTEVPECDCRVGGRYVIVMTAADGSVNRVGGRYVEVKAPERLAFTWQWESGEMREETLVTLEFLDRSGETELVLTHQRFPSESVRDHHDKGWAGCLDRLARLA